MERSKVLCIATEHLRFLSKTKTRRIFDLAAECEAVILLPKSGYIEDKLMQRVTDVQRIPTIGNTFILFKLVNVVLFILFTIRYLAQHPEIRIVYTIPTYAAICGYLAKKLYRKKWVIDLFDNPIPVTKKTGVTGFVYAAGIRLVKNLINHADLVIVGIVKESVDWLNTRNPIFITNGVDLASYQHHTRSSGKTSGIIKLVYIETSVIKSGVEYLLEAVSLLVSKGISNIELLLIGFLDGATIINDLRKRYNIEPFVSYLGPIDSEQLPAILSDVDIGVIPLPNGPHRDETYPLKVFEYMAGGLTIISFALQGIAKVVQNRQNGILITPNNPGALAEGLSEVIRNEDLRTFLSNNAKRSASSYDWKDINSYVISKIKELC